MADANLLDNEIEITFVEAENEYKAVRSLFYEFHPTKETLDGLLAFLFDCEHLVTVKMLP